MPEDSIWNERFQRAYDSQQSLRTAFARWYDMFYASSVTGNIAPWRSKIIDPKIAAKAKAVIAKISLSNPEPNLAPNDKHDFIKAKNNEVLLQNDLRNPLFNQPIFFKKGSVLTDATVCGTGLALLPWTYKTQKYFSRVVKNGKISLTDEKVKEVKVGYNDFIPVSIFRLFVAPGSQTIYDSPWVIIQDFKKIEDLKELAKTNDGYKNIKDIGEDEYVSTNTTRDFERSRNRLLSSTDYTDDGIEIWHCWDRIEGTYEQYANEGSTLIYSQPNYYWHGKYPMVPFYITPRAHSIWGLGLFEVAERLEKAGADLINHFFDQLELSMNGFLMINNGTTIHHQDISPGGALVWSGTEKPEFSAVPQPDAQGFQLARNILNEAIEENTISQYEVGIPRSNNDQTKGTKGGIEAIQEAASDMVRYFETSYAESCKLWYSLWLSNNQQFLDRERAVRILGPNGYYPKLIKPEDIVTAGQLDVIVDTDAMRPRSKETDRQFKISYIDKQMEIWQLSLQNAQISAQVGQPSSPLKINFYELSRIFAESMGIKEFDRIVEPQASGQDSPETENELLLQGQSFDPDQSDDHEVHIAIHSELMTDKGVDEEIQQNTVAHITVHKYFLNQIKKMEDQQKFAEARQMNIDTAKEAGMPYPGMANDAVASGAMNPAPTPPQPQQTMMQPNTMSSNAQVLA